MAGTDVDYPESNIYKDHTYYGNGCATEGTTGSTTACSSKEVATYDGETQEIGVYYTFPASAGNINTTSATSGTVTPDTFCPLGWQLPYGGTGGDYYDISKSWKYLVETTYRYLTNASPLVRSYPISLILSGSYRMSSTSSSLFYMSRDAHYRSGTFNSSTSIFDAYIGTGVFHYRSQDSFQMSVAVRCYFLFQNFIDGTVAGTPADLRVHKDSNVANDHTYYGNGCTDGWGTGGESGDGGSITPCPVSDGGGRYTTTADNETQKIGTYYTFSASTTGTGGTMTTSNSNSPDTFCPLGWQLPYSGTGGDYYDKSKSRKYLLTTYNIGNNPTGSSKTRSYPLSNNLSGFYFSAWGKLYYKNGVAYYWSSTVNNLSEAARMYMYSGVVTEEWWSKTAAVTVRCNPKVSILILKHN